MLDWKLLTEPPTTAGRKLVGHRGFHKIIMYHIPPTTEAEANMGIVKKGWEFNPWTFNATHWAEFEGPKYELDEKFPYFTNPLHMNEGMIVEFYEGQLVVVPYEEDAPLSFWQRRSFRRDKHQREENRRRENKFMFVPKGTKALITKVTEREELYREDGVHWDYHLEILDGMRTKILLNRSVSKSITETKL